MKFPLNRLALIVGAFILVLMAIDGLIQMNSAAMADFGFEASSQIAPDSTLALFLVGLIAGMVVGIGMFFGFLMYREKMCAEQPDSLDELLNEIALEADTDALFVEDNSMEEKAEKMDPWEKPADWWKSDED